MAAVVADRARCDLRPAARPTAVGRRAAPSPALPRAGAPCLWGTETSAPFMPRAHTRVFARQACLSVVLTGTHSSVHRIGGRSTSWDSARGGPSPRGCTTRVAQDPPGEGCAVATSVELWLISCLNGAEKVPRCIATVTHTAPNRLRAPVLLTVFSILRSLLDMKGPARGDFKGSATDVNRTTQANKLSSS